MGHRYDDVNPQDLDPETGVPYEGYSSPSLDTSFHDGEMDVDDDEDPDACTSSRGHRWVCNDEDDEISYCEICGADGNA